MNGFFYLIAQLLLACDGPPRLQWTLTRRACHEPALNESPVPKKQDKSPQTTLFPLSGCVSLFLPHPLLQADIADVAGAAVGVVLAKVPGQLCPGHCVGRRQKRPTNEWISKCGSEAKWMKTQSSGQWMRQAAHQDRRPPFLSAWEPPGASTVQTSAPTSPPPFAALRSPSFV